MNLKKFYQEPKLIAKARQKYPCYSTLLIIGVFASLLLSDNVLAAKDQSAEANINVNIATHHLTLMPTHSTNSSPIRVSL
jgi:hypothetical protein